MAGDLHDLQAAIASDAIVLVHHRRARGERGEFTQDRLGIAFRPTAPAFLAGARSEQLLLGHERKGAVRQDESAYVGGDGEPERTAAFEKRRPVGHHVHREALATEHVEQDFASAGRVRGNQCAAVESGEESGELLERLRLAALGAKFRRRSGREVLERQGCADRLHLDGRQLDAGMPGEGGQRVSGWHEGIGRRQERAFAVMTAFLVARLDLRAKPRERPLEVDQVDDHAAGRQVVA